MALALVCVSKMGAIVLVDGATKQMAANDKKQNLAQKINRSIFFPFHETFFCSEDPATKSGGCCCHGIGFCENLIGLTLVLVIDTLPVV